MRSLLAINMRLWLAIVCFGPPQTLAQSEADCAPAPGYREVALLGEQRDSLAGQMVSVLGDINGDGIEDYAVAAPDYSFPGRIRAGVLYVIYGNPRQIGVNLGSFGPLPSQDASRGFAILGAQQGAGINNWQYGGTIQAMGDLDGDGIDDFAVAQNDRFSPGGVSAGAIYLFYGKRVEGVASAFPSQIALADVGSGVYGDQVRVHYAPGGMPQDFFGTTITTLGDINRDGRRDFAVGMPGFDQPLFNAGQVLVYLGQPGRPTQITPHLTLKGSEDVGNLGRGLIGDFDFDGDGRKDVMACASFEDRISFSSGGVCYLLWGDRLGSLGSEFTLAQLKPTNGGDGSLGIVLRGGELGVLAGLENRVSTSVDINGDGLKDLMFGGFVTNPADATDPDTQVGRVYMVYGGAPSFVELRLASLAVPPAPGSRQLGFILEGELVRSYHLGNRLAAAGDVNADGVGDVLIAAPGDRRCGTSQCGSVWVILGKRGLNAFPSLTRLGEAAINAGIGYRFGPTTGGRQIFGAALESLRDFTGDGKPEWLVGAHASRIGDGIRGKACLYLSGNGQVFEPRPPVAINAGDWQAWLALGGLVLIFGTMVLRRRSE